MDDEKNKDYRPGDALERVERKRPAVVTKERIVACGWRLVAAATDHLSVSRFAESVHGATIGARYWLAPPT